MKLHYFGHAVDPTVSPSYRNFGDDLNPWLWDQLLPGVFDSDSRSIFVGIGSHMCDAFAKRFDGIHKVVFGTGWGSKGPIGALDKSWSVYCVRGPKTAQSMGLPPEAVVTDSAALIRAVREPLSNRKYKVSYMPHCGSANKGWEIACERMGVHYIDPRLALEDVLDSIRETEVLCTEALHGAIVADAMRVRWVPCITTGSISTLKWSDWCASVGVEYVPNRMLPIWEPDSKAGLLANMKYRVKIGAAVRSLRKIISSVKPVISKDDVIEDLTSKLLSRLEMFKSDTAKGSWKDGSDRPPVEAWQGSTVCVR